MEFLSDSSLLFHSFDQTWECTCAGGSDTIVRGELGHTEENLAHWLDEIETSDAHFINEDCKHLDCHILLFNLIGHNVYAFLGSIRFYFF